MRFNMNMTSLWTLLVCGTNALNGVLQIPTTTTSYATIAMRSSTAAMAGKSPKRARMRRMSTFSG